MTPLTKHIDEFYKNFTKDAEEVCWEWSGKVDSSGYGKVGSGSYILAAHRLAYFLYTNLPIPKGLHVRHSCHNPLCVNPKHLSLGTAKDNKADSVKANRHFKPKGDLNGQAKLTTKTVREIKQLLKGNYRVTDIAKYYEVSQATISNIKSGKSWGNV